MKIIESDLINQLRIIWKGEILPVWIQKNNCFVVTVGKALVRYKLPIYNKIYFYDIEILYIYIEYRHLILKSLRWQVWNVLMVLTRSVAPMKV